MDGDYGSAPSPDRARGSSWGGPKARAELRRIADDAARRSGFAVCAIEVLRADGLLELVAFTGSRPYEVSGVGHSFPLSHVRRVLNEGTPYGKLVFLAEEDMAADLQEALRGYGYVPAALDVSDPERWRPLDMLVAALTDAYGRTRVLLHLDEPLSGHRPSSDEMHDITARLDLALQAVLATVDRDELTRRARLDETARAVARAASQRQVGHELLTHVHLELVAGFRARSLVLQLHDVPDELTFDAGAAAAMLPQGLRPVIEAATRRAWHSRTVIVVEPGRVWGDDRLDRDHLHELADHLLEHEVDELLLVPVGAGDDPMGVLVVVRDAQADRWTEGESQAALGVGHDIGRALLSARAHKREQQLVDELQRLDEYRQRLIATVSHELKNPLQIVVSNLEVVEALPGLPQQAAAPLDALGRGVLRLTSLVDDLLLLSRVNTADSPVANARVDLGAVLMEVAQDESLRASQQGVTLRIAPQHGRLVVPGEAEELRRVLANLVSNAVKYSPGGTVFLSLEGRSDEVVFICADNGLGISEEDQQHLFTEFFRSTNPQALRRPGTGLGLAIVKRIVTRHRGRIEVETELGAAPPFVPPSRSATNPKTCPKDLLAHPDRTPSRCWS